MQTRSIGVAAGTVMFLAGCAHPWLKPAGSLAGAIKEADASMVKLASAEANTYRTYTRVQPLIRPSFNVLTGDKLDGEFVDLACRPQAATLVKERVALANLDKYAAYLEAKSTDPKDATLVSLIKGLSKSGAPFNPANAASAAEEFDTKRKEADTKCRADVRATFVALPSGNIAVGVVLAAWPKIKDFFTLLANEADKSARESAIVDSLTNSETKQALDDSVATLKTAMAPGGALGQLILQQKQLALWDAYAQYLALTDQDGTKPASKPYATVSSKIETAERMAAKLKVYDDLASVDSMEIVKKMTEALNRMREAAAAGKAPDDTAAAEIFAALNFLSDASSKYDSAASALSPSSSSKK